MIFQWNAWNREHIGKHGVTPEEAQHVVAHARPPFPRKIEDEKILVRGRTAAGRHLQVIFVYLSDDSVDFATLSPPERVEFEAGRSVAYVIHSRELTADEKRRQRRGGR